MPLLSLDRIHFTLLIVFLLLVHQISAEKFTVCQLARELMNQGANRTLLPDWVCLVQNESGMRTDQVGGPNKNDSYDYGLFQINSRWWCGPKGQRGGGCKVPCAALLDDDIAIATCCAWHIYHLRGFEAWNGWKKRCKGKVLPNLDECFTKEESQKFQEEEEQQLQQKQDCSPQMIEDLLLNRTQTEN